MAATYLGEEGLRRLVSLVKTLQWKVEPVEALPATGEERVLYLVPAGGAEGGNLFDEYIWDADSSAYELLGSATLEVDLALYARKSDFDGLKEWLESLAEAVGSMEAGTVSDVTASGTEPLTLEASKSGSVVSITGSVDIGEITAERVQDIWDAAE